MFKTEPCEMCGEAVIYSFSLCDDCDSKIAYFNERTGNYHMKNGQIVDTTKHQV